MSLTQLITPPPLAENMVALPIILGEDVQISRVGNDLIIKLTDNALVLRDYFLNPVEIAMADGQILAVNDILTLTHQQANPVMLAATENIPGLLAEDAIGTVTQLVNGPIEIQNAQGAVRTIEQGDTLYLHDTVITPARSYVKIVLNDGSEIQVGPLSRMSLDKYKYDTQQPEEGGELETGVLTGIFRFVSGQISGADEKQHTTIKAPSANIGIRGSEIDVQTDESGATTILFSTGLIDITTAKETLSVYEPGTEIYIPNDGSQMQVHPATPMEITQTRDLLAPLNPPSANQSEKTDSLFKTQAVEPESTEPQIEESPDLGAPNPFSTLLSREDLLLSRADPDSFLREETLFTQDNSGDLPTQTIVPVETIVPVTEEIFAYSDNPLIFKEDNAIILKNVLTPEEVQREIEILPPSHGSVAIDQEGNFTYTPSDIAFTGQDGFGYRFSADEDFTQVTVPDIFPLTIVVRSVEESAGALRADNGILIPVEMTQPAHGRVLDNGDGTLLYFPEPHYHGEDSFSYRLTGEPFIQVALIVESVNDAPIINGIIPPLTTLEDTSLTIPTAILLEQVTDIEGDSISLFAVNASGENVVSYDTSANTVTFSPAPDSNGQTSFRYTVVDALGARASSRAEVSVSVVNDPPIPGNDTFNLSNNPTLSLSSAQLLANDRDADGDALQITAIQNARNGSVNLNTVTGAVTFNAQGMTVDGSFDYVVTDGQESRVGQVTIRGNPVSPSSPTPSLPSEIEINSAPIARQDGIFALEMDNSLTLTSAQLLENDTDPDDDALNLVRVSDNLGGTVTLQNNGEITFVAAENFSGEAQFNYQISDGRGGFATATVFLQTDNAVLNQSPIAIDDTVVMTTLDSVTIPVESLLNNDSDPDQDALTIMTVNAESGGNVLLGTETVIFTPNADFIDQGYFTYTLSDERGGVDSATVSLTLEVPPINHIPQAIDDKIFIQNVEPIVIFSSHLLENDTDSDGDTLTIIDVAEALQGSVTLSSENEITFIPADNFTQGSFSYTISDGKGGLATATVILEDVNQSPLAFDDVFPLTTELTTANLLENDSDPEGDSLTVNQVDAAINGQVVLSTTGQILFTPTADFYQAGSGQFSYTIEDSRGGTATAIVTLTQDNTPPQAQEDSIAVSPTQPTLIGSALLLANDSDAEHNLLTIQEIGTITQGNVSLDSATGDILFTPNADFAKIGSAHFTYTLSDGQGGNATAKVTLTRTNEHPVGVEDTLSVSESGIVTILSPLLLINDKDFDGDSLKITEVNNAVNGQVALDSGGDIIFTPDSHFPLLGGQFSYTVSDGHGGTAITTVVLNKSSSNNVPIATADFFMTTANTPLTLSTVELLSNDQDIDNNELSVTAVSSAENGQALLTAQQTVIYTPNTDFIGIDQFSYTVADGQGGSAEAVVSVTVAELENRAPLVVDDELTVPFNVAVVIPTIDLLANDGDLDLQDNLTVSAVNQASAGVQVELINNEIRLFVDALTSDDYDTAHFDYTVSDGRGATGDGTVTLHGSNVFYTTPGDTVTDTEGLDILIGSERGDTFAPSVGADLLLGQGGDDIFLLDSTMSGILLAGGEGKDTLQLDETGQTLDLIKNSALAESTRLNLQSIEVIDLNGANQLHLSVQDVLEISDSGRLFVEGNNQSFVNSVAQGWGEQGIVGIDGSSYYQYLNGSAELLVSTEISARFIS